MKIILWYSNRFFQWMFYIFRRVATRLTEKFLPYRCCHWEFGEPVTRGGKRASAMVGATGKTAGDSGPATFRISTLSISKLYIPKFLSFFWFRKLFFWWEETISLVLESNNFPYASMSWEKRWSTCPSCWGSLFPPLFFCRWPFPRWFRRHFVTRRLSYFAIYPL